MTKIVEDAGNGFHAWPESFQVTSTGSICAMVKTCDSTLKFITYSRGDPQAEVVEILEYECIYRGNEKSRKEYV